MKTDRLTPKRDEARVFSCPAVGVRQPRLPNHAPSWEIDTKRTKGLRTVLEKLQRAVWLPGNRVIFRECRAP